MKKIGLCVRYDCNNYGSMLQIFATQEVVKKFGCDFEIIRYDKKTPLFLIQNVTRVFNPYFIHDKSRIIKKKIKLKGNKEVSLGNEKREKRFNEYRKKYIGPYSCIYKGYRRLKEGASQYDAVIVGSDQLWTPAGIKSKFYNLIFVPDNIRKISFATSFGVNEIPENQRDMTEFYLSRIDYLSVREVNGQKIIKKLTGRDSTIALDPALMLSSEEWDRVFPKKSVVSEPYIFSYFLGKSTAHRDAVEQLGKQLGMKIVTCPHMDDFIERDLTFGDVQLYDLDPIDFLNLIRGADFICTDSFHGTVFSILNRKKFMLFNRYDNDDKQSTNSRIDSLCELLGLENRRFTSDEEMVSKIKADINYNAVNLKLENLRKNTMSFLEDALTNG